MRVRVRVAVVGCCHGELNAIYSAVADCERASGKTVDLLLVCGDFQSIRNNADLTNLCVPPKYKQFGDFHEYYSGARTAPVLTLFVGGNHESSAFLWELYYGGWVAPNIYFMGWANVVRFGGLRIAGASGIYKQGDYFRGHPEQAPYNPSDLRSIYHIRHLEIFRLSLYRCKRIDLFMSHDWPRHIAHYGDTARLLNQKRHFREDVISGNLGAPPLQHLMQVLAPRYWFAAHLHVKFAAVVAPITTLPNEVDLTSFSHTRKFGRHLECAAKTQDVNDPQATRFLALDKCLPRRHFVQIVEIDDDSATAGEPKVLEYDPEWLAILRATCENHRVGYGSHSVAFSPHWKTAKNIEAKLPLQEELVKEQGCAAKTLGTMVVPLNFVRTAPAGGPKSPFLVGQEYEAASRVQFNSQTADFCTMLGIPNRICGDGVRANCYGGAAQAPGDERHEKREEEGQERQQQAS